MPSRIFRISPLILFSLPLVLTMPLAAHADGTGDRADMQKRLNEESMQSSFETQDVASIEKYIESSKQKGITPKTTAPEDWQPGYTCDSYYRTPYRYSYSGYRDCLYHYRYYNRYW